MMDIFSRFMDSMTRFLRYVCRVILLGATLAGVILIIIDLVGYFFDSSDFTVQQITISGNDRVNQEEIVAQAGIAPGSNIWLVDVKAVGSKLEEHPAIRAVMVQRVPPQRIHIQVEERYPIAFLFNQNNGILYGVDEEGIILPAYVDKTYAQKTLLQQKVDAELVLSCPMIQTNLDTVQVGETVQSIPLRESLKFLKRLQATSPDLYKEIAEGEWRENENFVLHPRYGIGVIVLRNLNSLDLEKKLAAFWSVLTKHDLRAIYVDARFPDKGFAVRFDESDGSRWKQLYKNQRAFITQGSRVNG